MKICLLFTDLLEGVHYLTNDREMCNPIEESFRVHKGSSSYLYSYEIQDYPFKGMGEDRKSTIRSLYPSTNNKDDNTLSKREIDDEDESNDSIIPNDDGDIVMPTPVKILPYNITMDSNIEKRDNNNNMINMMMRSNEQSFSIGNMSISHLDKEERSVVESFTKGMESIIDQTITHNNRNTKRDEDMIVLLLLRDMIRRYYTKDDSIGSMMREKVVNSEIIRLIDSIRFKDKSSDMILVMLKQMNDNLLELILNPSSFNSEISLQKSGRSLINIFIFLIKNYFQQIKIMKGIYCEDSSMVDVSYMFNREMYRFLDRCIILSLDICGMDRSNNNSISNHSAFKSYRADNADNILNINNSNNVRDMNETSNRNAINAMSSMFIDRSMQFRSRATPNHFIDKPSFDYNNSLKSENSGIIDIDGMIKNSDNNMNKFVSSLLNPQNK